MIKKICYLLLIFFIKIGYAQPISSTNFELAGIKKTFELNTNIYDIACFSNSPYVYIASNNGLYVYTGRQISSLDTTNNNTNNNFVCFTKTTNNQLFAHPYFSNLISINNNANYGSNIKSYTNIKDKEDNKYIYIHTIKNKTLFLLEDVSQKYVIASCDTAANSKLKLLKNYSQPSINNLNVFFEIILKTYNANPLIINHFKNTNGFKKSIYNNYLFLNESIYEIINNNIQYIGQLGLPKNTNATIKKCIKDVIENQYYILVQSDKENCSGLYLLKNTKCQLIIKHNNLTGICKSNDGTIYLSTLHNGLFKLISPRDSHLAQKKIIEQSCNKTSNLFENDQTFKVAYKYLNRKPILKTNSFTITPNQKSIVINSNYFNKTVTNKFINNEELLAAFEKKDTCILIKNRAIVLISKNYEQYTHHSVLKQHALKKDNFIYISTNNGLYGINLNNKTLNCKKIYTNSVIDSLNIISCNTIKEGFVICSRYKYYITDNNFKILNEIKTFERITSFNYFNNIIEITGNRNIYFYTNKGMHFNTLNINLPDSSYITASFFFKNYLHVFTNKNKAYSVKASIITAKTALPQVLVKSIQYNKLNNQSFKYISNAELIINCDIFNLNDHSNIEYTIQDYNQNIVHNGFLNNEQSIISITNLNPKNYSISWFYSNTLLLKKSINIIPNWYQTILFKLICTTLVIFCLIVLIRYLLARKEKKFNLKNTRLLLDAAAKSNQLESHFIFNSLMPLHNYILNNENKKAEEYLVAFSQILRTHLTISKSSFININNEINFLKEFLFFQKNLDNRLIYEITTCNYININKHLILIPVLVIQPIVENAIKYAKANTTSNKKVIKISFEIINTKLLKVIVFDSGTGINQPIQTLSKDYTHAIGIISKRLRLLLNKNDYSVISSNKKKDGFEIILKICYKIEQKNTN